MIQPYQYTEDARKEFIERAKTNGWTLEATSCGSIWYYTTEVIAFDSKTEQTITINSLI